MSSIPYLKICLGCTSLIDALLVLRAHQKENQVAIEWRSYKITGISKETEEHQTEGEQTG